MDDKNTLVAREIITQNRYLTLATRNHDNVWIAPLAYAVDENYNFYVYSALDSIHIQHIKYNPAVAFSIFNSTLPPDLVDGLQIAAVAGQVEARDLELVTALFYSQIFEDPAIRAQWSRPPAHFAANEFPFQRFFQLLPEEIYKVDTSTIEVDRRLEIKIADLRSVPAKVPTLADISAKLTK